MSRSILAGLNRSVALISTSQKYILCMLLVLQSSAGRQYYKSDCINDLYCSLGSSLVSVTNVADANITRLLSAAGFKPESTESMFQNRFRFFYILRFLH